MRSVRQYIRQDPAQGMLWVIQGGMPRIFALGETIDRCDPLPLPVEFSPRRAEHLHRLRIA